MSSYTSRIASSSLLTIAGNIGVKSIGVVSTAIMARLLAPQDFGVVAVGAVVYGLFSAIGDLGARDYILRSENDDSDLYCATFTFRFAALIFSAMLLAGFAAPIADFYGDSRIQSILYVYSLCLFVSSFDNVYFFRLMKSLSYKDIVRTNFVTKLLNVFLNVVLALLLHDYRAIVYGVLGARIYHCVKTHLLADERMSFSTKGIRKNFQYAKWMFVDVVIGYFRSKSDLFVAPRFLDPSQMGFYEMGRSHGGIIIDQIFTPVNSVLLSAISKVRDKDPDHLATFCLQCCLLVTVVFSPVVVVMWSFMDVFVSLLLGDRWLHSVGVFRFFLVFSFLTVFSIVINEYFVTLHLLRQKMLTSAVLTSALLCLLVVTGYVGDELERFASLRAVFSVGAFFVMASVLQRYVRIPVFQICGVAVGFLVLAMVCLDIGLRLTSLVDTSRFFEAVMVSILSCAMYFAIAIRAALYLESKKTSKLFIAGLVRDLVSRLPAVISRVVFYAFVTGRTERRS